MLVGSVLVGSVEDCDELDVNSDVQRDSVLGSEEVVDAITMAVEVEVTVETAGAVEEGKLSLLDVDVSVVSEEGLEEVLTGSVDVDGACVLLASELDPAPAVPEGCAFSSM